MLCTKFSLASKGLLFISVAPVFLIVIVLNSILTGIYRSFVSGVHEWTDSFEHKSLNNLVLPVMYDSVHSVLVKQHGYIQWTNCTKNTLLGN